MGICKEKILQQQELKMKILQEPVGDNNNAVTNNQPVLMKKKAGNLPQHAELVNNAA